MKSNINLLSFITLGVFALVASCTEEKLDPVLGDSSTFVAPVLTNAATTDPKELLPQDAGELYEKFEWEGTEYGVNLSTDYTLEIDDNEDFSSAQNLAQTSRDSANVTVEDINDAMLALGLPGFEESTVYIRLKSAINGYASDPLFSNVVTRTITTYQSSECGNFCSIGIVGDATPGGWDVDTDMRLADATKVDKYTWTLTAYLTAGGLKFRASDAWDANWGAESFPTGTGAQDGANIPIPTEGYYKITFNDNTAEYTITALGAPTFSTVGVIGSGTAGGWDSDTDLTKDPGNPHVWTGTITLTDGAAKFRAENDWGTNWGSDTYPSGYGYGNGPDIPVKAGTYSVWFHDVTGEYFFMPQNRSTPYATVGVIGPATPGGWDSDTDLIKNPGNPFLWSKSFTLTDGEAKFRADDDWAVNWGGSTFPGGVGAQDGPNVPVKGGTHFVSFNSGTGEYYFLK